MSARLVIFIISVLFLYGCSSPLEKSVLYPLKAKEIDKVVMKDKSFLTTYSIVEEKWNYISTPQDSSRWRDVTYGRLHSFLQTIGSDELNTSLYKKLRVKWEEMNVRNNNAADSIIGKWKQYLSANSPDSLVFVSFTGVELEKIRNKKKEIDTLLKAGIKIKALKPGIDSLSFSYYFAYDNVDYSDSILNCLSINSVNYRKVVKDSVMIKVFPDLSLIPKLKKSLASGDSTVSFKYFLKSVNMAGKCYNSDSLKMDVPPAVLAIIEGEASSDSPDFDANHYREQIIRGLVDPGFISQSAYIKINSEQYYRQLDSLVSSYLNYRGAL